MEKKETGPRWRRRRRRGSVTEKGVRRSKERRERGKVGSGVLERNRDRG